jgi:membrane AbrB-like protein
VLKTNFQLPDRQIVGQVAETIAIALAGGGAFQLAGLPAGLISGSVLAVAGAALAGRPMVVPLALTRFILVVAGIALGSGVTPETLRGIATYPLSIALLVAATLSIFAGSAAYLRVVHRWDRLSALYGASPGALAQVIGLAVEGRADLRAIVIVQSVRVLVLAIGIPWSLTLFGFTGGSGQAHPLTVGAFSLEMLTLVVVSIASAVVLTRLKFPGGWLFGAMVGSGALHGAGLVVGRLPLWIGIVAMVGLGAINGSRFANTDRRMLLRFSGAALGSLAVGLAIAALFIAVAVGFMGLRPTDLAVAYAPGAQDTMMVLALALNLDPVFIGAHHLARFLVCSVTVPVLARYIERQEESLP